MKWQTKSPLATVEKICSKSNERSSSNTLKYLIPHCTAGNANSSGLSTATYFCNTDRQCSANYCIGPNDTCLCIPEYLRAWCSGGEYTVCGLTGRMADYDGINMELSSDTTGKIMYQSTIDNFIKLAIDICKRYGKNKVLYFEDKYEACTYKPKNNEVVLLKHAYFANKSCWGEAFQKQVHETVAKINDALQEETEKAQHECCKYWKNGKCTKEEEVVEQTKPEPFKLFDAVKLKSGAKYSNGKIPQKWVYSAKLYIREWNPDADTCVVSTIKEEGTAITGRVFKKDIMAY